MRDDEQPDEVVRKVRRRTVGDDVKRVRVDDLGLLHPADVDRRRVRAHRRRHARDRELHVLGREIRAVVEFHAALELELPRGRVDRLPAFGKARFDLQPVAGPHQRVEHVLEGLGVGAGRSEVRIDRVRPAANADGERLRETRNLRMRSAVRRRLQMRSRLVRVMGWSPYSDGCRPLGFAQDDLGEKLIESVLLRGCQGGGHCLLARDKLRDRLVENSASRTREVQAEPATIRLILLAQQQLLSQQAVDGAAEGVLRAGRGSRRYRRP